MTLEKAPILWSKLRAPSPTDGAIDRPRLVDQLSTTEASVWMVTAPAGYGKTTLLAQALADDDRATAWVSVDRADNDAVRFWTHVSAALGERLGDGLDHVHQALVDGEVSLAIDRLIASIDDSGKGLVLVLDDLHELEAESVLDDLSRLISLLPAGLTVAILTRSGPALPLARLRTRGEAVLIGPEELAFTLDEGRRALAPDVESGAMTSKIADELVAVSDGWAAGLRLAQLAARGGRPIEAGSLGGHQPDVATYLAGEVLETQSDEGREFLIVTSILDDLTPGACDAVTQMGGSLRLLRSLVAGQVFTSLVDPDGPTFRYHRLFREFLNTRLVERDDDVVGRLHAQAADWFEQLGDPFPTITHAVAAGDHHRALDVLADCYIDVAKQGQIDQLWSMVQTVGADRVLAHPELAPLPAWTSLNQRRFDEIDPWLESIALVDDVDPDHRRVFDMHAAVLRSHRDRHLGRLDQALAHGRQAATMAEGLPGAFIAPSGPLMLGVMLTLTGDDAAGPALREALDLLPGSGDTSSEIMAHSFLGATVDDVDAADEHAAAALALVDTPALERFYKPAMAWFVRSRTALARGRIGDAEDAAERALLLADAGVEPAIQALVETQRARNFHLTGRGAARRAALKSADRHLSSMSGAEWIAEQIRSARAETRFAPRDDRHLPAGARELTERELAVLRLLPHRLPRRELAAQLFLSENTVKTHIKSIRRKLGLGGRDDIVARARELGLLPEG